MTHATATVDLMRPPFPAEPGSGVYSNKLGMWVFLASDVMFFTALIGTYIILRFGVSQPWAHPNAVLNVPLTAFNTFLLICSSVSMVKAFAAISQGRSEEHTSELQSLTNLVCRLLLEKKNKNYTLIT